MKKITKKLLSYVLFGTIVFNAFLPSAKEGFIITTEAHQGRTDSSGGHRDNKNKSGLGYYHYHCGGYPAHLHTNGCPYSNGYSSSNNRNSSNTSSGRNSDTNANSNSGSKSNTTSAQTLSIPDNISLVYDSIYYAENNSDLLQAYGYDSNNLLTHFLTSGMKEGRVAKATFNVHIYKDNNPDLVNAFGDNMESYYHHYMNSGYTEGRITY